MPLRQLALYFGVVGVALGAAAADTWWQAIGAFTIGGLLLVAYDELARRRV